MLLRHRTWSEPPASEITPRTVYLERRSLLRAAAGACALPALAHARTAGAAALRDAGEGSRAQADAADRAKASGAERAHDGLRTVPSEYSTMERPTPYDDVTGYNNFYEFGTDKDDPARYADRMRIRPWSVSVEGEVARPRSFDVEELMKLAPLEERIYRMRCVEGWSMVIPWVGYPFSELMKRVEPTGNAKYVEFTTLADPKQMPGLRSPVLEWPYVEGLRIDEAANALTLLGVGVYGEALPKQNGAPVRVVVPWKYGFKSAKSLVKIRFVERQPLTAWQRAAPREYGFYSNVNPEVDHPRWSQATERRIGEGGLFARKRPTRMFNGYADQVASLYAGMDLRKEY